MSLPPLCTVFGGKHLVVTGVTGFVGKVWLSQLLAHVPDVGRITLVVRPNRRHSAMERFALLADTSPAMRPLKHHHGAAYGSFLQERIEVVAGDVSKPDCGLDDAALASVANADAVVHIAGLTDFHPDPKKGVPANVDGALHAASLALRTRSRRMLHISTCYVAGTSEGHTPEQLERGVSPSGDRFDPEAEHEALRAIVAEHKRPKARTDAGGDRAVALGWPNLYTFTKGLAEHLLAGIDGLKLTIARPSVVECSTTWPFEGWNEGLNTSAPIMWFCGTPFLTLPSTGSHRFDIIPVDGVARRMTVILAHLLRDEAEPVYQLGSSYTNPTTFERIVELTALGKRRHADRPGATARDWMISRLDVRTHAGGDARLTPGAVASVGLSLLDRLSTPERTPSFLRDTVDDAVKSTRKRLQRTRRDMNRIDAMLEQYQPFIHDHDWEFVSANTEAALAAVHPHDAEAFTDELSTMCWRHYWMNVQYPGVARWSFPIMEGETVSDDQPSSPPLRLDAIAWPRADKGAA